MRRPAGAKLRNTGFSWGLALLLAAFAVHAALAYPIEEHAYDAAVFHVYRGVVFSAARADGWLYPRWVQAINAGLGGPLFAFYSPALYLLLDLVSALGIARPLAWRLLVALAFLVLTAGAFKLALALFKRADVALVCAVASAYAPYVLQEFFERGSPQGFAIALYPWLLWLLLRLALHPSGLRLALAALLWALIILIHNVAALLLLPILAVFLAYLTCRAGARSLLPCGAALAAGLLVAACSVVPFVAEGHDVKLENASLVDYTRPAANPLALSDLLAPPAVLDSGLGNNAIGQRIGPLEALAMVLGAALAVIAWRGRPRAAAVLAAGLAIWGLVAVWLQTRLATWVWAALPALSILQFRWRLLGTLGFASALLLAWLVERAPQRLRGWLSLALVVAAIGLQLPSLYPALLPRYASFPPAPTAADAQAAALQTGVPGLTTFSELTPRWRQQAFTASEAALAAATPIANLPEGSHVLADDRLTGRWDVRLQTPAAFEAQFYLLYFPGWTAYVDGVRQPARPIEGPGYLALDVPAGEHTVTLRYEGTAVEHVADAASLLAAAALVLLALLWRPAKASGPLSIPCRAGSHTRDSGQASLAAPADRASGCTPDDSLALQPPQAWEPAPLDKEPGGLSPVYLQPRWWLPLALVAIIALKAAWVDPHTTWLRTASTCSAVARAQTQSDVWFGDAVHLCAYTLPRRDYRPGDTLAITLYWQIDQPVAQPADGFVHLLGTTFNPDTNNPLWGQQDKQAPGEHPLTNWVPGSLYRDTYEFRIPPHTPPGAYQLEIGWWQPNASARLTPRIDRPQAGLSVSELDALLISGIQVH